jgi:integrase
MELRTLGWAATLKKRKPEAETKSVANVGDFIEAVRSQFVGQSRTVEDYCRHFRRLVADVMGIERPQKDKYDYFTGGRLGWIRKVNAVPLANITPQKIQAWRVAYLEAAGDDLEKRRSAQNSVSSILRQARSLFAPKRLELIVFDPPVVSPFAKIKLEPENDMRYRSNVDAIKLVETALAQLADKPEVLKAFLLAVCAGLRRAEIDRLEWSAFDWGHSSIHVGPTRYLHVKSQKSIGDVDLDPETAALFHGYYAGRHSDFVIQSDIQPRPRARYSHYRCDKIFSALISWLRGQGVKGRNPIHAMRKEFGSLINQAYGIYAASSALRHADITITAKHYVGKKARTTVGLGHLLAAQANIIPLPAEPSSPSATAQRA